MPDEAAVVEPPPPPAPAAAKPKPTGKPESKPLPPYHVVLLNDEEHSYAYVIEMLGKVCAHPVEVAFRMAEQVDTKGRVIVLTTHKERAELKREQIVNYGADVTMATSTGSMRAVIEPAMG